MNPDRLKALEAWRVQHDAGAADPFVLHKGYAAQIKAVGDPADRTRQFTISTADVDRDRDTVAVAGWKLDNYRRNPVVLWAHDSWSPPIGKALSTTVADHALVSLAQFASAEEYPFADTIYRLLCGGFLNATSVGFQPFKWTFNEDRGDASMPGVDFLEQELLEYSIVPVPSNPNALGRAKAAGINVGPLREWAERALDEWSDEKGLWLPRSTVEQALSVLATKFTVPVTFQGTEPGQREKGAIPFARTPKADVGTAWDGPAEVAKAEPADLRVMCAWEDATKPEVKSSYKLPHHQADGEHAVVWNGVRAAGAALMGAQGGVDIPDADRDAVRAHLAKHYAEFDKTPPWEADAEANDEGEGGKEAPVTVRKTGRVLSDESAKKVQKAHQACAVAMAHLKELMDAAGVNPLDAGDLDNTANPLDATDPDGDDDGDANGGGDPTKAAAPVVEKAPAPAHAAAPNAPAPMAPPAAAPLGENELDLSAEELRSLIQQTVKDTVATAVTAITGRLP